MVEFSIHPSKTALLVIDMTSAFLEPKSPLVAPGALELVPKLSKLADTCREKGIPVIFTAQFYRKEGSDIGIHAKFRPEAVSTGLLFEGSPGSEFYEGLRPKTGDIVIIKKRFSAFLGTELDLILRHKAIDTLIITGCATNICCETTTRDARMRDYQVIFLSDGTAPQEIPDRGWGQFPAAEVQRFVLATMADRFAQVLSVEEVLHRLRQFPDVEKRP